MSTSRFARFVVLYYSHVLTAIPVALVLLVLRLVRPLQALLEALLLTGFWTLVGRSPWSRWRRDSCGGYTWRSGRFGGGLGASLTQGRSRNLAADHWALVLPVGRAQYSCRIPSTSSSLTCAKFS